MSEIWHRIACIDEIDEDEPLSVKVGDHTIGVFQLDGEFYAIEDVCPHAFALLSQGFVEGDEVECPLHEAVFHIPTGRCLKAPADRDLQTYQVRVEGDDILIGLPT